MGSRASSAAREDVSSSVGGWITSQNLVPITGIYFNLLESLQVARKVGGIVPAHGVDVGLRNLPSKGRVRLGEVAVQILEFHQPLLLDNLGIDVRGPHRPDLRHQVIPNSFDRLVHRQCMFSSWTVGAF